LVLQELGAGLRMCVYVCVYGHPGILRKISHTSEKTEIAKVKQQIFSFFCVKL